MLESNQEWDIFKFIKFWEKYQLTESLILDVTNNLGTNLLFTIFINFLVKIISTLTKTIKFKLVK